MIYILIRMLACLLVIFLPFALLAIASGKAEGMLWLMLPMVVTIPVLVIMAAVFVPIEALLSSQSTGLKNVLIPVAGALAGIAGSVGFQMLLASASAPGSVDLGGKPFWVMVVAWAAIGAILGGIWRLSELLAKYLGWI